MNSNNAKLIKDLAFWFAVGLADRHILNGTKYPHGWRRGYVDGRIDTTRMILQSALRRASKAERTNIGRGIRHELERQRRADAIAKAEWRVS